MTTKKSNYFGSCMIAAILFAALSYGNEVRAQEVGLGGEKRCITESVSVKQTGNADSSDDLVGTASGNGLFDALLSGRHFFACPMTPEDGHGEGPMGPRSTQRMETWPDGQETMPFLRMNGMGTQRCWECHNSAGVFFDPVKGFEKDTHPPGPWVNIKPGGLGGAAGFENTLFGNPNWPDANAPGADGELVNIVRSSPSIFGTGYLQRLAFEMSRDLFDIKAAATEEAKTSPDFRATKALEAKGIAFGSITIDCHDSACENPTQESGEIVGISADLIVRPLQHKGVSSTVRSFVMSALDFHMSVQPVELVGANNDCDKDGLYNEMSSYVSKEMIPGDETTVLNSPSVLESVGNVTTLTAWAGLLRPPQFQPINLQDSNEGRALFADVGCTDCHAESLTIDVASFNIQSPTIEIGTPATCPSESNIPALGSNAVSDPDSHPVVVEYQADTDASGCPEDHYCIDLSNNVSDPLLFSTQFPDIFGDFLPRLPHESNKQVRVPLYSDLRRWTMGKNLEQIGPEQNDDSGNPIPNNQWLTSKLWGVADTGPWLHDGRARTLKQAILQHEGEGSDANEVMDEFKSRSVDEQQKIVRFLESLRLPANPPVDNTVPTIVDGEIINLIPNIHLTTKMLELKSPSEKSKRNKVLFAFKTKDSRIKIKEIESFGDPTEDGAMLTVYNAAGSNESVTENLPAEQWSKTSSGYRYHGDSSEPVQYVRIKNHRLDIRAGGENWDYPLDANQQGQVAVAIQFGRTKLCASAPARNASKTDRYDKVGFFQAAHNSPAPKTCPVPPGGF